jgi:diguanylate cyclase (GGDEF)-like protein
METLLRRKDGKTIWVRLRMTAEKDPEGLVRRVHGLASDITRQKKDTERLQHEACTDSLTGLFNRGYLLTCFRGMLARAKRTDRNVGLLFIDLDGFKQINDEHGHQVGDALLRKIAGAIRETMCRDDFAARLGGDEFAVLLWDIKDQKALRLAAQKTHNAVCGNYQTEAGTFSIGLSIGASLYPDHGEAVEELLNMADKAMYRCKTAEYLDVCVAETP